MDRKRMVTGLAVAWAALAAAAASAHAGLGLGRLKGRAESDRQVYYGDKFLLEGNDAKAVKFFKRAAQKDPANASAFEALARAWTLLKRPEKARDAQNRAEELGAAKASGEPDRHALRTFLLDEMRAAKWTHDAYRSEEKGDFRYAVELFRQALSVDPGYAHAQAGLEEVRRGGWDRSQTLPTRAGRGRAAAASGKGGLDDSAN